MDKKQIIKIIDVLIVAVFFMLVFEIIFAIPQVEEGISNFIINLENRWLVWLTIWIIMFIQVCIIPIPGYIVLNAAVNIGIINTKLGLGQVFSGGDFWILILVTISAYMAGALFAYFIGAKLGKKAVLWAAGSEEDYDKWREVIYKKGKWAYALTVILPLFPDDLLCLVCGSMKFDLGFFVVSNVIGRTVGLITMVSVLVLFDSMSNGSIPWSLILWGFVFILMLVAYFVLKNKIKQEEALK